MITEYIHNLHFIAFSGQCIHLNIAEHLPLLNLKKCAILWVSIFEVVSMDDPSKLEDDLNYVIG
jgi:hypothetical protein